MSRYIAFLRAINVGGHTVKMEVLRQLFETLGFSQVESFIARGNMIFEMPDDDTQALEHKIEHKLREALGYPVAAFIRSAAELAAIAAYQPFPQVAIDEVQALNIAFLSGPPETAAQQKLMTLKNEIDDFQVHGREIYWLCRKKQSESTFSNGALEKTIGMRATLRGINTIRKMAAKYAS